jgi:hypothetical protein
MATQTYSVLNPRPNPSRSRSPLVSQRYSDRAILRKLGFVIVVLLLCWSVLSVLHERSVLSTDLAFALASVTTSFALGAVTFTWSGYREARSPRF